MNGLGTRVSRTRQVSACTARSPRTSAYVMYSSTRPPTTAPETSPGPPASAVASEIEAATYPATPKRSIARCGSSGSSR